MTHLLTHLLTDKCCICVGTNLWTTTAIETLVLGDETIEGTPFEVRKNCCVVEGTDNVDRVRNRYAIIVGLVPC